MTSKKLFDCVELIEVARCYMNLRPKLHSWRALRMWHKEPDEEHYYVYSALYTKVQNLCA